MTDPPNKTAAPPMDPAHVRLALRGALREVLEEFRLRAMVVHAVNPDGTPDVLVLGDDTPAGEQIEQSAHLADLDNASSSVSMMSEAASLLGQLAGMAPFRAIMLVGVRDGEPIHFVKTGAMSDPEVGTRLADLGGILLSGPMKEKRS